MGREDRICQGLEGFLIISDIAGKIGEVRPLPHLSFY